ncbi:hypothetical protein TWF694_000096 [Orbilia ellipsospora]|uniref:NmrA-like domain-containing protein n=1 Tax=Orbilia ellipsospora TaxID=2528407 RepID=A0AAV9XNI1_9PEZI
MSTHNVLIIGAAGKLGTHILKALIAEPKINVTILTREDSTSTFPSGVSIKKADYSSNESLVAAFKGHDTILSLVGGFWLLDQLKFVDAAVEAGVKRFYPSEFGSITGEDSAELVEEFWARTGLPGKYETYLRLKKFADEGKIEYVLVQTGPFFDMGLSSGFLGINLKDKKATVYGSGNQIVAMSNLDYIAKATVYTITHPEEYKNRAVKLYSYKVSQNQLLGELEKITGTKWETEHITVEDEVKAGEEGRKAGNPYAGYQVLRGFVYDENDKFGSNYSQHDVPVKDETTLEDKLKELLNICRPPDDHPEWGVIVIDPTETLCALRGPEAATGGQGMLDDWKWRISVRRPEGNIPYTYVHLVGPVSSIPMTNNPDKPSNSWFGYGVNNYKDYEASIFEVARYDEYGNRVPQAISFENPLTIGDILDWAGPNGEDMDDYQLRLGSNTEGGVQRIMRSDEPLYDFPPIRLVVTELDEADIVEDLDSLDLGEPELPINIGGGLDDIIRNHHKPPVTQAPEIKVSYIEDVANFGPSRLGHAREVPPGVGLGRSLLNKLTFGATKAQPQTPEPKEDLPMKYKDPSKSRVGGEVIVEKPKTKSRWGGLFGKGKDAKVEAPKPMGHAREPILEDKPALIDQAVNWFGQGTSTVKSLLQRIPKPKKKEKNPILVKEKIQVDEVAEDEDQDLMHQSSFKIPANYGSNAFGGNVDFGNEGL